MLTVIPFDRLRFVMSVLEVYPDHDCGILPGCMRADVPNARMHVFQQMAASIDQWMSATSARSAQNIVRCNAFQNVFIAE